MIISKFHFFKIQREFFFRDTMKFYKSLFSITPETFQTIDIHFTRGKSSLMVNFKMPVATKHKGIVTSKFISIYNRTTSNSLYSHLKDRLCRYIFNNLYLNFTFALKYPKNRDFIKSTSASFTLSSVIKNSLVKFYFTAKKLLGIMSLAYNRISDYTNCFKRRRNLLLS